MRRLCKRAWERWEGYRTIALNAAYVVFIILVEVVGWLNGFNAWDSIFSNPKVSALVTVGLGVLNIVLRTLTTTAVFKKMEKTEPPK